MNKVFIINGIGGSGKDTFVDFLVEQCPKNILIHNLRSSDRIKDIASKHFSWDGKKDEKGRKLLADLMCASREYNDGIFMFYSDMIKHLLSWNNSVVFSHVREPLEIEKYVKEFNAITILVKRDGIITPNNDSDNGVFEYDYDFIIDNNGTLEELKNSALKFLNEHILWN